MIIHYMEQGSDEWHKVRELKLTGSKAQAIQAAGAGLVTLCNDLILKQINPNQDVYVGKDMERGNELEQYARSTYEMKNKVTVHQVGFIEMNHRVGVSPDGLIGDKGMWECKAKNDANHLKLLLGAKIDIKEIWQMQMQLYVAKREWCDFVSYNVNFKTSLYERRVLADPAAFKKIEAGLAKGIKMLDELLEKEVIQLELN